VLRHSKNAPQPEDHALDALDEQLLAAIDAGLSQKLVLAAVPCGREEALARLMRLMTLGIVEDDAAPVRSTHAASDEDPFDDEPTGLIEATHGRAQSGVVSPVGASRNPDAQPALDDMDRAILNQADAFVSRMSEGSLYALFGVASDAPADDIRAAYATLARRFHPESFAGKPIAEHRKKLELIVITLTRAYEVLYNAEKRAAYDRQLGIKPREAPSQQRVQAVFARSSAPPMSSKRPAPTVYGAGGIVLEERPAAETVRKVSISPARSMPAPQPAPHKPADSRLAREPQPAPQGPADSRMSRAPQPAPSSAQSTQSLLREVMAKREAEKNRAPAVPTSSGVHSHPPRYESPLESLASELASSPDPTGRWSAGALREAHNLEKRGEVSSALALMQVVVSRFGDPRVREQRDRLLDITKKASSNDHREKAVAAQNSKNYAQAADHWRNVSDADRKDGKAALEAAVCYMHAKEMKLAGQYAKRAVELQPQSVLARRVLLRFYEQMGMELNANRERQALEKLSKG
jgi:curved DNA-binding protein CbpA